MFKNTENKNELTLELDNDNFSHTYFRELNQLALDDKKPIKLNIQLCAGKTVGLSDTLKKNEINDDTLDRLKNVTELQLSGRINVTGLTSVIKLLESFFTKMPLVEKIEIDKLLIFMGELPKLAAKLFPLFRRFNFLKSLSLHQQFSNQFNYYKVVIEKKTLTQFDFFAPSLLEDEILKFKQLILPIVATQIEELSINGIHDESFLHSTLKILSGSSCLKSLSLQIPEKMVADIIPFINKIQTLRELKLKTFVSGPPLLMIPHFSHIYPISLPSLEKLTINDTGSLRNNEILCQLTKETLESSLNIKVLQLYEIRRFNDEALKAVNILLERNQLVSLALSNSHHNLSDLSVNSFCSALAHNKSLIELDVSHFRFSTKEDHHFLLKSIIQNKQLKVVKLGASSNPKEELEKILQQSSTLEQACYFREGRIMELDVNNEAKKNRKEIIAILQSITCETLSNFDQSLDIFSDLKNKINKEEQINSTYVKELWHLLSDKFIGYYADSYNCVSNPDYFKYALYILDTLSTEQLSNETICRVSSMLSRATKEDGGLDTQRLHLYSLVILSDATNLDPKFIRDALILYSYSLAHKPSSMDIETLTGKKKVLPYKVFIGLFKSILYNLGYEKNVSSSQFFLKENLDCILRIANENREQINQPLEKLIGYPLSEVAILEDIICKPHAYPLKKKTFIACDKAESEQFAKHYHAMLDFFREVAKLVDLTKDIESVHSQVNSLQLNISKVIENSNSNLFSISTKDAFSTTILVLNDIIKQITNHITQESQSETIEGEYTKESKQEVLSFENNKQRFFNSSAAGEITTSKRKKEVDDTLSPEPSKQFKS